MASTSASVTKQGPPRRLSELLQEEQEPFVLEIYLLERGCRRRSLEIEGRFGCCSSTSNRNKDLSKVLKRSSSHHGSSSTSSGQFSNIGRSFYSKIVSISHVFGLNGLNKGEKKRKRKRKYDDDKEVSLGSERCSSVSSCSTLCNSCSVGSELERDSVVSPAMNATVHEPAGERLMTQWRFLEDNKQCSPVSVLDEIDFLQDIPIYNNVTHEETVSTSRIRFQKKISQDPTLSATLLDLLVQSRRPKPERDTLPPQMNSKKAPLQTGQLLFDCVKEVVEMGHKEKQQISRARRKQRGLIMGPEEVGKTICSNLKVWGKLSTDDTNIAQLLRIDLLCSTEEWGSSDVYRRDVAWDIGDGILEEITDDIVKEMIDQ